MKTHADRKYKEVQTEISYQIKQLSEKIKKHSKSENKNYGHVGDLNRVKALLDEINQTI